MMQPLKLLLILGVAFSCKRESASKLFVENGEPIMRSEYPTVLPLYSKDVNICVLTFVSPTTAITAAHCISGKAPNEVGILNAREDSSELISPVGMYWLKKFDETKVLVEQELTESAQKLDRLISTVQYDVGVLVFSTEQMSWNKIVVFPALDVSTRIAQEDDVTIAGYTAGPMGGAYSQSPGTTANVDAWLRVNGTNAFPEGSLAASRLKAAHAYKELEEKIKKLKLQQRVSLSRSARGDIDKELAELEQLLAANPWSTDGSVQPRLGRNRIMVVEADRFVFALYPAIGGDQPRAGLEHGDSGGPAFNAAGSIIGIASGFGPAKLYPKAVGVDGMAQISFYEQLNGNTDVLHLFATAVNCAKLASPPCADIPDFALGPQSGTVGDIVYVSSAKVTR